MQITFNNIYEHIISINTFHLKWRFTEEKYKLLPKDDLNQLKPLDNAAAKFFCEYLSQNNLHDNFPFKKDIFKAVDTIKVSLGNEDEIKQWLYQCGLPFDEPVFLSWDEETAMIVNWEMVIKYFDSFYYPSSDDLTVFDKNLKWTVLFYHEDEIYFGTK